MGYPRNYLPAIAATYDFLVESSFVYIAKFMSRYAGIMFCCPSWSYYAHLDYSCDLSNTCCSLVVPWFSLKINQGSKRVNLGLFFFMTLYSQFQRTSLYIKSILQIRTLNYFIKKFNLEHFLLDPIVYKHKIYMTNGRIIKLLPLCKTFDIERLLLQKTNLPFFTQPLPLN